MIKIDVLIIILIKMLDSVQFVTKIIRCQEYVYLIWIPSNVLDNTFIILLISLRKINRFVNYPKLYSYF